MKPLTLALSNPISVVEPSYQGYAAGLGVSLVYHRVDEIYEHVFSALQTVRRSDRHYTARRLL